MFASQVASIIFFICIYVFRTNNFWTKKESRFWLSFAFRFIGLISVPQFFYASEIFDSLVINKIIFNDHDNPHEKEPEEISNSEKQNIYWISRINNTIEKTKSTVDKHLGIFLENIAKDIRNITGDKKASFKNQILNNCYFNIDKKFRKWLSELHPDDDKNKKEEDWYKLLFKLLIKEVNKIMNDATTRDIIGVYDESKNKTTNIFVEYNRLIGRLIKELNIYKTDE